MKVIYKYQIPVAESFSLHLPEFSEVIRIDSLNGMLWLWALVDTDMPLVSYNFNAYKTGGEIPKNIQQHYVGCAAIFIQMELMLYFFLEAKKTPIEAVSPPPRMTLGQFMSLVPAENRVAA